MCTKEQIKVKGEELEARLEALCKEIENFIYTDDVDVDNLEVMEEYGKWNNTFSKIIKAMH